MHHRDANLIGLFPGFDHELAAHLTAAVVDLQVAVERERPGLVGAEFEGDGLPGAHALGDPVGVDGQAVRDVLGSELDLDQIVLAYLSRGSSKSNSDDELASEALS